MPVEPIPFGPLEESGVEQLAGAARAAHNVVIDSKGAVTRRPSLRAYSGAVNDVIDADGVLGLITVPDGRLFAVGGDSINATIYFVDSGGKRALSGPLPLLEVRGGRPVLSQTEALLVAAAGGEMQKVVLSTEESSKLSSSALEATHVVAHQSRLVANDISFQSRIRYSGLAQGGSFSGHLDWAAGVGTGGAFSAEARPDPAVALAENTNELFVWGTTSVQVFANDAQFVYSPASTREHGCAAPYSIVNRDEAFAWLDHRRRFVVSDGRTVEVISGAIQHTLDSMGKVSDCFGYRVHHGWLDALVWTFPTDGRTYVFSGGMWSQWGFPGTFRVTSHHQRPDTGENLVGDSNGYISLLDFEEPTDRGDPVTVDITTGFLNRGTSARKLCRDVKLELERGKSTGTEPVALVYYRDDPGEWLGPVEVGLGAQPDSQIVVSLGPQGVYRRREWRLVFSGDTAFKLVSATEQYETLSY